MWVLSFFLSTLPHCPHYGLERSPGESGRHVPHSCKPPNSRGPMSTSAGIITSLGLVPLYWQYKVGLQIMQLSKHPAGEGNGSFPSCGQPPPPISMSGSLEPLSLKRYILSETSFPSDLLFFLPRLLHRLCVCVWLSWFVLGPGVRGAVSVS